MPAPALESAVHAFTASCDNGEAEAFAPAPGQLSLLAIREVAAWRLAALAGSRLDPLVRGGVDGSGDPIGPADRRYPAVHRTDDSKDW